MFTAKDIQDQNQGNGGSNYTNITEQKLNIGDCKMNFGEELKGTQVNQNNEENVAIIGEGKEIIKSKDAKNLKNASRIIIEDGVKEIGKSAFSGFDNLKKISLPRSIQRIGKFAFKDCKNLIKVESYLNVNVCDKEAFKGCEKLDLSESFIVDDYRENIEDGRFYYKKNKNGEKSLIINNKNSLPLFGEYGPDEEDIQQGEMGDCWLVAALASISHYRPDIIKNMLKDNEDGTVDVTLQREFMPGIFRKEIYTVRKSIFKNRYGGDIMSASRDTIWVQMIEKAYAAYLAKGNQSVNYNGIFDGDQGDKIAYKAILGQKANNKYGCNILSGNKKGMFTRIKSSLDKGIPMHCSVFDSVKDTDGDEVHNHHAYSIMGAYKNNDKYYLRLRNPWGKNYSGHVPKSAYITLELEKAIEIFNLGPEDNKPAEGAENSAVQDDKEGLDVIGRGREIIISRYAAGSSWASEIIIADGVREIGERAFNGFSSLKKITIPASVKKIGANAFRNCGSLTEVELNDGIKEISQLAFNRCTGLKRISIPGSVEKIGRFAFSECESLEEIELNDGIKEISDEAFRDIKGLKKISIPGSVKKIGVDAFFCCENLEEIELNDGIKEISVFAFSGCKSLKRISIPGSVEKIEKYAFFGCEGLEKVEIKNSATQIDERAFEYCKNLGDVNT